jgi:hypothetical protein
VAYTSGLKNKVLKRNTGRNRRKSYGLSRESMGDVDSYSLDRRIDAVLDTSS